jgi:hypothetical protein
MAPNNTSLLTGDIVGVYHEGGLEGSFGDLEEKRPGLSGISGKATP